MPLATDVVRKDHELVKRLFRRYQQSNDGVKDRGKIAQQIFQELELHARIEEELFYPEVRATQDEAEELIDEAEQEHHIVDVLVRELREMTPSDEEYGAKMTVLRENVEHHIEEEEGEMLPMAEEELDTERLMELAKQMDARKKELTQELSAAAQRSGRGSSRSGGRTSKSTKSSSKSTSRRSQTSRRAA